MAYILRNDHTESKKGPLQVKGEQNMKRFFAIIILLTAGALLVSPGVSHALYYDALTLTDYDGYDVVYNDEAMTSEAAYIYYKTVEVGGLNETSYQIFNVAFDPIPATPPPFPNIGELFISKDNIPDPSAYTFGAADGDYVAVDDNEFYVRFVFSTPYEFDPLYNPNLTGIPTSKYSGIFTSTTALFIGEGDTVLAELWDGGEYTDACVTFALHLAKDDPGTPMPEPGTLMLLGGAMVGLAVLRRK